MATQAVGNEPELEPGEERLIRVDNAIEAGKGNCVIYFTTARLVIKADPSKTNESITSMKRFPLTILGLFIFYTMVANPLLCSMFTTPLIDLMPESALLLIIRGVGVGLIGLVLFLFAYPIGEKSAQEMAKTDHAIRHADIKKALLQKRTIEYPALSYSKLRVELVDGASRFDFGIPLKRFDDVASVLSKLLAGREEIK